MPSQYPRIVGPDNLLTLAGAAVTASTSDTTDPGYPAANLTSWRDGLRWRGTGAAEQYVQVGVANPMAAPGDDWSDLAAWTETDPNNSVGVLANKLRWIPGAGLANDAANITVANVPVPITGWAMELPWSILASATCDSQKGYWEFTLGAQIVRLTVLWDAGGNRTINFEKWFGGAWVLIGTYAAAGFFLTGRLKVVSDGVDVYAWVYDTNGAAYHALGAAGFAYAGAVITSHVIGFELVNKVAGSSSIRFQEMYYAPKSTINSLALSNHNLFTQGAAGVYLAGSVGGVGWASDVLVAPFTPANDFTFAKFFTSGFYNYYRLIIPAGYVAPPTIGIMILAPYMEIPDWPDTPHDPDHASDIGDVMTSGTGRYLGSVVEGTMRQPEFSFSCLTYTWVRATWLPFRRAHGRRPFVFLWDPGICPDEAYFVWIATNDRAQPYQGVFRTLQLTLNGVYE